MQDNSRIKDVIQETDQKLANSTTRCQVRRGIVDRRKPWNQLFGCLLPAFIAATTACGIHSGGPLGDTDELRRIPESQWRRQGISGRDSPAVGGRGTR